VVSSASFLAAQFDFRKLLGKLFLVGMHPTGCWLSSTGILDFPKATLRAYPRETVVAEKFEALVKLGMVNTRMKDFYDLWILALEFEFSGPLLCKAIEATFAKRNTELPATVPLALTEDFFGDSKKAKQWSAFVGKSGLNFQYAELRR
jgi:Nucleotidyl transferase AbiEii toxin, Type IV TA system